MDPGTESPNCTAANIYNFPPVLVDYHRVRYDHAAIGFFVSVYLFLAMAIVCDEYFVPAIERLCYNWKIPYNIAGATFMAAGTSSPEFFVNVVATFITEGDIGAGTIVGSSVFNSLGVSACCGLAGVTLSLDWWPLTRDILWYFLSAAVLTIIIFDNVVVFYEALGLVSIYLFYVIALVYDDALQNILRNKDPNVQSVCSLPCYKPTGEVADFEMAMQGDPSDNEDEVPYNVGKYPCKGSCLSQLLYVFSWPIQLIYCITIPNVRYTRLRNWYIMSIICSCIWISVLSYVVTWMLTVVGHNLFIPDTIMGITFLAICTSIPEIVSSVIVTRKGYGSMSVCNAVGSNIFNIVLCLGVPWLIRGTHNSVYLISFGMAYQSLSMILTGLVLYAAYMSTHFTLCLRIGVICLISYLIYIVFAVAAEMNVFGLVNLETCLHMHESAE